MSWIHCNKCYLHYNPQATFFLVECGHVFCHRCAERIKATKECLVCKKHSNIIALNKEVEKNILDFFLPVENVMKKLQEIYKFQTEQRQGLYNALLNKYNYTKKEYMNIYKNNKLLMKENEELRMMVRSAGKHPQKYMTSTPMSVGSSTNMTFRNNNGSVMSSIPPPHKGLPPRENSASRMRSEFIRRNQMLSSGGSSQRSSVQRVPLLPAVPFMQRKNSMGMRSLEELRRGNKS